MISRREFLAAATCAVSIGGNVFAADMLAEAPANAGPKVYGADFTGPLPSSLYLRGRLPPSGSEEATARRIINAAPRSTPLAVMRYFAGLRDVNRDGEAYNAGWASRWNPVIVEFYRATDDDHSGDRTPWCAAFLNWCLERCGYDGGTRSTVSGSFRKAGGLTRSPSVGDVVVFKRGNTGCRGHVALYLGKSGSNYRVIGGNQTDIHGHSSINIRDVPFPGSGLALHSFHRVSAFRPAVSPRPSC